MNAKMESGERERRAEKKKCNETKRQKENEDHSSLYGLFLHSYFSTSCIAFNKEY